MRFSYPRRETRGSKITLGVMLTVVGVAVATTNPAIAVVSVGLPGESYAWLISEDVPQLPDGPVTANSTSEAISALQHRLEWTALPVEATGTWDTATTASVKRFQQKHILKATGEADAKTVALLGKVARDGRLDPRCVTAGVSLCVDKSQLVTRYVKDGKVIKVLDTNIGPEKGRKEYKQYSTTREGSFKIFRKVRFETSTQYGTPLPFFMQFNGGEGFHYSEYFDVAGYQNSTYGCPTLNDKAGAKWLFQNSPKGTRVVVYD